MSRLKEKLKQAIDKINKQNDEIKSKINGAKNVSTRNNSNS